MLTCINPMIVVPGGTSIIGSESYYPEEGPCRSVTENEFQMQKYPVSNSEFADFVENTGYTTVAERDLDPALFPGAPAENLKAGSLVFTPTQGPVDLREMHRWWRWTPGACWHRPEGPGSSVDGRENHPVVQIAFEDAAAYAEWRGLALPTEQQWERAARGGLDGAVYAWGDDELPGGMRMAKYYEGSFPWQSRPSDGFVRTAAVGSYPANGYELHDMIGNVWEWTQDWYLDRSKQPEASCCTGARASLMPSEPTYEASLDPTQPAVKVGRRVVKGGSFLCASEYCLRYRPSARRPQMVDTGMSHIGFRCCSPRGDQLS